MKERWNNFYESDISSFDLVRNFEKEELFGGKDIVKKIMAKGGGSQSSNSKENHSFIQNTHTHTTHVYDNTTHLRFGRNF